MEYYSNDDDKKQCKSCGMYCPGDTDDICFKKEYEEELFAMNYHRYKNFGYWYLVKLIIANSFANHKNNIFLIDILEDYLNQHNINLFSITEVNIKYNDNFYIIPKYESQYLLENLKINSCNLPSFNYEYNKNTTTTYLEIIY
jgi:hypothetical protein